MIEKEWYLSLSRYRNTALERQVGFQEEFKAFREIPEINIETKLLKQYLRFYLYNYHCSSQDNLS